MRKIREIGELPIPGSFLAQLNSDLDDANGLGSFAIHHEEERHRRNTAGQDMPHGQQWRRFVTEVTKLSCIIVY